MFDRDEPTREKEVYLSVRATDNGQPTLDDTCTIKVTIEDVNDNPPVFDKVVSADVIYISTFSCFIGILLSVDADPWSVGTSSSDFILDQSCHQSTKVCGSRGRVQGRLDVLFYFLCTD